MKGELDIQKELLPYLQEIVSLEQAAYVEESLLNAVKNERENTDTRKYVVPEPKPPEPETIDTESFALITVFVGGPIAIGVGVLRSINTFDFGAGFGAAFIVFAIFAFLVFLWVAVDAKQTTDDRKEKYQQALAQYPIDVCNGQREHDPQAALRPVFGPDLAAHLLHGTHPAGYRRWGRSGRRPGSGPPPPSGYPGAGRYGGRCGG